MYSNYPDDASAAVCTAPVYMPTIIYYVTLYYVVGMFVQAPAVYNIPI